MSRKGMSRREHNAELRANGMAPRRAPKPARDRNYGHPGPVFSAEDMARTERDLADAARARAADDARSSREAPAPRKKAARAEKPARSDPFESEINSVIKQHTDGLIPESVARAAIDRLRSEQARPRPGVQLRAAHAIHMAHADVKRDEARVRRMPAASAPETVRIQRGHFDGSEDAEARLERAANRDSPVAAAAAAASRRAAMLDASAEQSSREYKAAQQRKSAEARTRQQVTSRADDALARALASAGNVSPEARARATQSAKDRRAAADAQRPKLPPKPESRRQVMGRLDTLMQQEAASGTAPAAAKKTSKKAPAKVEYPVEVNGRVVGWYSSRSEAAAAARKLNKGK